MESIRIGTIVEVEGGYICLTTDADKELSNGKGEDENDE